MNEDIRNNIDKINLLSSCKELIVSYDCSDRYTQFRQDLLKLLSNDTYKSSKITESNYKIGKLLNNVEVEELKTIILNLFNETVVLSDEKENGETVVKLIFPLNTKFTIEDLINKIG